MPPLGGPKTAACYGVPVEVRKDAKSTIWYEANILDVCGKTVRLGFRADAWPDREVPAYSVRRAPGDEDPPDAFDPQVDDLVEALMQASAEAPVCWALARVLSTQSSFYLVGLVGMDLPDCERLVERRVLRRVSMEPAIDSASLVRRVVPIDPLLHDWAKTSEDWPGCLGDVRFRAGLVAVRCTGTDQPETDEDDDEEEEEAAGGPAPGVLLIGTEGAVDLGERVLVHHFGLQIEMIRFSAKRERMLARLSALERNFERKYTQEFTMDADDWMRTVRMNIGDVRKKYGVEIRCRCKAAAETRRGTASGKGRRRADGEARPRAVAVSLSGDSEAAVLQAQAELECMTIRLPEKSLPGGEDFAHVRDVALKTDLHYVRFDHQESALELCGRRHQVERAARQLSSSRPGRSDNDRHYGRPVGAVPGMPPAIGW